MRCKVSGPCSLRQLIAPIDFILAAVIVFVKWKHRMKDPTVLIGGIIVGERVPKYLALPLRGC